MAHGLLLTLALLLLTTSIFTAALSAPWRLRGAGHAAGEEANEDSPTEEAWTGTDDSDVAAFFAAGDDLGGQKPFNWTTATAATAPATITTTMMADTPAAEVAAVLAAALQQGPPSAGAPPNINRWITYDNEYQDPTYFFPGDIKPVWESVGGEVRLNGQPFHIKGISWFGFETGTRY